MLDCIPSIRKNGKEREKEESRTRREGGKGGREKAQDCLGFMGRKCALEDHKVVGRERLFNTVRIRTSHYTLVQIHRMKPKHGDLK